MDPENTEVTNTPASQPTTQQPNGNLLGGTGDPQPTTTTQPTGYSDFNTFRQSLPEDIRDAEALKHVGTFENLAKQHVHAQTLIGRKGIPLPPKGPQEDPESWKAVYRQLGAPEKPEDYGTVDLPEGFQFAEGVLSAADKTAVQLGLNKTQRDGMIQALAAESARLAAANNANDRQVIEKAIQQAKTEFGAAYNEKLDRAETALVTGFSEATIAGLKAAGLTHNVEFIKDLNALYDKIGEDRIIPHGSAAQQTLTPAQASNAIKELNMNQDFMAQYMNPRATGHREAVEKYNTLRQQAQPPKQNEALSPNVRATIKIT